MIRFLGISSVLAVVLSAVFYFFFGSPIDKVLTKQVNSYKYSYIELNIRLDSLQSHLHNKHFTDDRYYRELLELDSIPTPIRLAGTGGSEKAENMEGYPYHELIKTVKKRLNIIKSQIKIQNESFSFLLDKAVEHNSELKTIPAIQPVKPSKYIWISSYYGRRTDPFTFIRRYHKGIDFVGPKNTKIYATADGKISKIKISRRGYGKEIIISHNFGYSTCYAHLNKVLVKEGQVVKRGELIGLMGNTGRSTGTHLHYEVRKNRRTVNPIYFYSEDLTESEYDKIVELAMKKEKEE